MIIACRDTASGICPYCKQSRIVIRYKSFRMKVLDLFDHLIRHHGLPVNVAADVLTAPEWAEIDRMDEDKKAYFTSLRAIYSSALVNGPFSVILGSNKGLLAINDRLKLRSLTAATKGDRAYFASEESAIRIICPNPEKVWSVSGADPVFVPLEIDEKEDE